MALQNQLTVEQLQTILSQTLSPDADTRKAAEGHLAQAQKVDGHPLITLRLVATNTSDPHSNAIRQAAAVHFKNLIKKGWDEHHEDGTDGITISPNDGNLIKNHLVDLMCTAPPQIQKQCSEAIALIAQVDYPQQWDNLLPELVQKFHSPDMTVVNGVLATANSILKRFRYVNRSDELYADIIYTLERLQAPLLTLFKTVGQAVDAYKDDVQQLRPRFEALRYMCRIFFSLNWQELPAFFEDHMGDFMMEFSKYLKYKNPLLEDEQEETEPSLVDKLQTAVVENLFLYGDKDEEPFIPFLPDFVSTVWNLLMGLSGYPKHDTLATTCIKFLSSLVGKPMHRNLFMDEQTLKQIIAKIVIPNLMIREVDEEKFEDDPQEFIMGDMEDSDTESRRKRSQGLLRAMCKQFETETTAICMEQISAMLNEFQSNPTEKWAAKDAAIHLLLGISVKAESNQGVSQVNDKVNVMEFFTAHILTELQESNHASRPMVKATAIKFASTFRNQFSKEHLAALMPLLINHLGSPSVVVHTYSAAAIEKFLVCKDSTGKKAKFGGQDIVPFLEPLFTGLFSIVDNSDLNENEYVMKCIMRSLSSARDDIIQVVQIVLEKLTAAIFVVAKNPRNPQYNHYLFESIAVLVKAVCSKHPEHVATFEGLLFPPFQQVLQMDVAEFSPYVFQILAQLLEYRADNAGLGEAYGMLLPPLLSPVLWERRGNIPALTRLLQAYLMKGAAEIVSKGQLNGMLGVFQKLISSKASEISAFDLLGTVTQCIAIEPLDPLLRNIFQILLMRLQQGKTPRYVRLVTDYFAQFIGQYGSEKISTVLNSIQPGLLTMILSQVWLPRLTSDPPVRMAAKIQIVGLSKIIFDTPSFLSDANGQQIWTQALLAAVKILTSEESYLGSSADKAGDQDAEIGYDPTMSRLAFASRPPLDPFSDVSNVAQTFAVALNRARSANDAVIQTLIQQGQSMDPKSFAALDSILSKVGM